MNLSHCTIKTYDIDDLLCLSAGLDVAHGTHEGLVADYLLDVLGELGLVAWAALHLLLAVVSAAGHVDDIHAAVGKEGRELGGLVDGPALAAVVGVGVEPVSGAEAHEQRHCLGDHSAHSIDELEGETGAVLEAAAVLIRSLVNGWCQE
ncbi:hypothetical protein HG530_003816 [Fusarium avenaceum]|nr:hypothetical protein HG530_003816 [Fusarium avenaceum]